MLQWLIRFLLINRPSVDNISSGYINLEMTSHSVVISKPFELSQLESLAHHRRTRAHFVMFRRRYIEHLMSNSTQIAMISPTIIQVFIILISHMGVFCVLNAHLRSLSTYLLVSEAGNVKCSFQKDHVNEFVSPFKMCTLTLNQNVLQRTIPSLFAGCYCIL